MPDYLIGYALPAAKKEKIVTGALVDVLRSSYGIDLVEVDPDKPIADQGCFHAIFHKLRRNDAWRGLIQAHLAEHPQCAILDRPEDVAVLEDRHETIVSLFPDGVCSSPIRLGGDGGEEDPNPVWKGLSVSLCAPKHCTLRASSRVEVARDIGFPLVAKSLLTFTSRRHEVQLMRRAESVDNLSKANGREDGMDYMLQEFIEHADVMLKAYNLGTKVFCDARVSAVGHCEGPQRAAAPPEAGHHQNIWRKLEDATGLSVPALVAIGESVCRHCRRMLGLTMFNVDLIFQNLPGKHRCMPTTTSSPVPAPERAPLGNVCPSGEVKVFVIDVNYFPGYPKLADYESKFAAFLADTVANVGDQG